MSRSAASNRTVSRGSAPQKPGQRATPLRRPDPEGHLFRGLPCQRDQALLHRDGRLGQRQLHRPADGHVGARRRQEFRRYHRQHRHARCRHAIGRIAVRRKPDRDRTASAGYPLPEPLALSPITQGQQLVTFFFGTTHGHLHNRALIVLAGCHPRDPARHGRKNGNGQIAFTPLADLLGTRAKGKDHRPRMRAVGRSQGLNPPLIAAGQSGIIVADDLFHCGRRIGNHQTGSVVFMPSGPAHSRGRTEGTRP